MSLFAVVAYTSDTFGIGVDGHLPWPKLKSDFQRFRDLTIGEIVVMGRKTWESLPLSYRPLPKRHNVVVSSSQCTSDFVGATLVSSLEEALAEGTLPAGKKVFVIGGSRLLEEAVLHPAFDTLYATEILEPSFCCDTFLTGKTIDELKNKLVAESCFQEEQDEIKNKVYI